MCIVYFMHDNINFDGKAQGVADMPTKVGFLQQFNRGVSNKAKSPMRFTKIY